MAKKKPDDAEQQAEAAGVRNHQRPIWVSWDQCWASCVKNGNSLLKESAKAHLKAIGKWNDQRDWISGLVHFGLEIEK